MLKDIKNFSILCMLLFANNSNAGERFLNEVLQDKIVLKGLEDITKMRHYAADMLINLYILLYKWPININYIILIINLLIL